MTDSAKTAGVRPLNARELLEAFKKEHGIKSNDLARSLMFIETFKPVQHPGAAGAGR